MRAPGKAIAMVLSMCSALMGAHVPQRPLCPSLRHVRTRTVRCGAWTLLPPRYPAEAEADEPAAEEERDREAAHLGASGWIGSKNLL